jgi:hypothetical protein
MKTLLYTITDFSPYAAECINLLSGNMIQDTNVDYCVISNNPPPPDFKYNVVQTKLNANYVGFLKFYSKIPDGYDHYIYMDSDILFFGNPLSLIPTEDLSIVIENCNIRDEWHSFHINDKNKIPNVKGLNAGTFVFSNKNFVNQVNENILNNYNPSWSTIHNAMMEQSVFNMTIGQTCNFDWTKYKDITDITKLHVPTDFKYNKSIKIYHFCGWAGQMCTKYIRMIDFLKNNEKYIKENI